MGYTYNELVVMNAKYVGLLQIAIKLENNAQTQSNLRKKDDENNVEETMSFFHQHAAASHIGPGQDGVGATRRLLL